MMLRMLHSGQPNAGTRNLRWADAGLCARFLHRTLDVASRRFQAHAQEVRRVSMPFAAQLSERIENRGARVGPAAIHAEPKMALLWLSNPGEACLFGEGVHNA